jgi:hypothetical protein
MAAGLEGSRFGLWHSERMPFGPGHCSSLSLVGRRLPETTPDMFFPLFCYRRERSRILNQDQQRDGINWCGWVASGSRLLTNDKDRHVLNQRVFVRRSISQSGSPPEDFPLRHSLLLDQQTLRRNRQIADSDPGCVEDCIRDRSGYTGNANLADPADP